MDLTKKKQSFYDYVMECSQEFIDDQRDNPDLASVDEIFFDMARSIIDSGGWRDEGFTASEVRQFCKSHGIRFGQ